MDISNKISFSCGVEYKGKLYIASINSNELFQYDIENNKLTYYMSFNEKKKYLYRQAIVYKDCAWFIPQCADNIAIVNFKNNNIDYIPLKYEWIEERTNVKCISAGVMENHYLYIVPFDIDTLLIIDMDTYDIKEYSGVGSENSKYTDAFYYQKKMYCIPWTAANMLEIDMINGKKTYIPWQYGKEQYAQAIMDFDENRVWLIPSKSNNILIYDLNKNVWENIQCNNKKDINSIVNFYGKIYNNNIFIFPFKNNKILGLNKNNLYFREYELELQQEKINFIKPIHGEKLYAIIESTNKIVLYDEEKDIFKIRNVIFSQEAFLEQQVKQIVMEEVNNELIVEGDFIGLQGYLNFILD